MITQTTKQIGKFLREKREALGLTQADLADKLSLLGASYSRSAIAWWEQGRTVPPIHDSNFMNALASALEVSFNELSAGFKMHDNSKPINEDELSEDERTILEAFRSGKLEKLMRVALEILDSQ